MKTKFSSEKTVQDLFQRHENDGEAVSKNIAIKSQCPVRK